MQRGPDRRPVQGAAGDSLATTACAASALLSPCHRPPGAPPIPSPAACG